MVASRPPRVGWRQTRSMPLSADRSSPVLEGSTPGEDARAEIDGDRIR
jgi:hypothetical protein